VHELDCITNKMVVFDEVYILFHFNIILKHKVMSSTKILNSLVVQLIG
jgi:hypothetical protein